MTLLVFLKAPVPGRVKTRLASDIGAAAAARAYVAMARAVRDSALSLRGVRVVWVYRAAAAFPDLRWLERPRGPLWPQASGDLGRRLAAGFSRAFREGARRVCAIGADSPDLPAGRVRWAFAALQARDAVLGPAEDGGYYLLGLRRETPSLFSGIAWSGPRVRRQTLERASAAGLSVARLPLHYDVDDAAGLRRWLSAARARG